MCLVNRPVIVCETSVSEVRCGAHMYCLYSGRSDGRRLDNHCRKSRNNWIKHLFNLVPEMLIHSKLSNTECSML